MKKNKVRSLARYFKLFVIVSSALTTICLGLNFSEGSELVDWSRNLALVFSALATGAATLIGAWDLDNYWMKKNVLITNLERLSDKLNYFISTEREISPKMLDELFYEYQSAMEMHTDYWKEALESAVSDSANTIPRTE